MKNTEYTVVGKQFGEVDPEVEETFATEEAAVSFLRDLRVEYSVAVVVAPNGAIIHS